MMNDPSIATYLGSLALLTAVVILFFVIGRGRYAEFGVPQRLLRVIVALPLVLSAIVLHFLHKNEGTAMLPPVFPAPGFLVIATGVLEILGAFGLFVSVARRSAALWIAIMMVLIFPVNVYVAGQTFVGLQMPAVPVRLTMQVVYIWMVLLAGYGIPGRRSKRYRETRPD
jgi:uncharacterized membrane protein